MSRIQINQTKKVVKVSLRQSGDPSPDTAPTKILLAQPRISVIRVVERGERGLSGAGFVHVQGTPSDEWTINHNLGFKPAVEIINLGGSEVDANVIHISVNQVKAYFVIAIAGEARCT